MSLWRMEKSAQICFPTGKGEASVKDGGWTFLWELLHPLILDLSRKLQHGPSACSGQMWSVQSCFCSCRKCNSTQHWSSLLTKGVARCHYLPANIHPIGTGIERAQNFINLKNSCKMVKLSRGERHSESLLDNLNKEPLCVGIEQLLHAWQIIRLWYLSFLFKCHLAFLNQLSQPPTTHFWELISPAWK